MSPISSLFGEEMSISYLRGTIWATCSLSTRIRLEKLKDSSIIKGMISSRAIATAIRVERKVAVTGTIMGAALISSDTRQPVGMVCSSWSKWRPFPYQTASSVMDS